nr:hypothetical protein CFP56_21236 [Quercus suber]
MSRNLSVTEPHPTVPSSGAYLMGGRGGAGNYKRYTSASLTSGPNATGPASRVTLSRPAEQRRVPSGRGGAGNMYAPTEQTVFHFDEEMIKRREVQSPIYHIGRGGAANFIDETKPKAQRSGSNSSVSSSESTSSVRRSLEAVGKLTRKISRS